MRGSGDQRSGERTEISVFDRYRYGAETTCLEVSSFGQFDEVEPHGALEVRKLGLSVNLKNWSQNDKFAILSELTMVCAHLTLSSGDPA